MTTHGGRSGAGNCVDASALDALSWGLLDAGVGEVTGYPGFHAHELIDRCGGSVSANERTAYAVAWGASVGGTRSAVTFKNVGLNDAADTFLNSMCLKTNAGMVVVLFDDVEVAGSQSRQDSRPYFDLCPGLWLEPVSTAHAYWCAREAATLSERFEVPVVLRVTNALMRTRGRVCRKTARVRHRAFRRDPSQFVAHPVNARRQAAAAEQRQRAVAEFVETFYRRRHLASPRSALVRAGAATDSPNREIRPCVVWTYPLPVRFLRRYLRHAATVEVVEQGSPFVCEKVCALSSRVVAWGRDLSAVVDHSHQFRVNSTFESLYRVLRSFPDRIVCADLGSFTMDPARTADVCLCYGASVAVAIGCSLAPHPGPVFCVTGDAAFLHSGQACLEEGQRRGARVVVIVLDNEGAVSTGGQAIPGSIRMPPGLAVVAADHATATSERYRLAIRELTGRPGMSVLHVRC